MKKETIFIDGMFVEKPHPNAPKWIKLRISMKVIELVSFLKEHINEKGYVNIDINKSKDGTKYYATLNQWKKGDIKDELEKEIDEFNREINADDIPF